MDKNSTYVGLDLSLNEAVACAMASDGTILQEWTTSSNAESITNGLEERGYANAIVGFETGLNSGVILRELIVLNINAVCIDARHAHKTLSLRREKTDKIDARGLAKLISLGWYQPITLRTTEMQMIRAIIKARRELESLKRVQLNKIRGLFHTLGIYRKSTSGRLFIKEARGIIERETEYRELFVPILRSYDALDEQLQSYNKYLTRKAASDDTTSKLMSVPGVGAITALSFMTAIDHNPRSSKEISSFIGLCPRVHESGQTKRTRSIGYTGEPILRSLLFIAARSIITVVNVDCELKRWGTALRERLGFKRAAIAVARKIATILYAIVRNGTSFQPEPSALPKQ